MDLRTKCILILVAGILCVGVYFLAVANAQQGDAVSTLTPHVDAAGDLAAEQAVTAANNRFAVDFYHTLVGDTTSTDRNIFFLTLQHLDRICINR